nr:zincin-like metallopeptidase domain-containing protein [Acidiphilium sp.]
MANAGLSGLQRRPSGIIRVAALCPLCRYRHKGHWSGAPDRLARDMSGGFGSANYAKEELVALSGQSAPALH